MTKPYTVGFILEQTLGHRTHSANLEHNVAGNPSVHAVWGPVPWETTGVAALFPGYRSNWTVRAGLRARSVLRDMRRNSALDALFIHTQVPAVFLVDQLPQIPTVISLDATPAQYDTLGAIYGHAKNGSWLESAKRRLNQVCFDRASRLVTWSRWTAESLVEDYGVSADKIEIIPPGVNIEDWERPEPKAGATNPVKILFVGGDLERKGGLVLLQAVRRLRNLLAQENSDIQIELHLVTHNEVREEPGVFVYNTMQPNSDELKALFHASDLFCLPTFGDCLPMVLSEAGAAGLPLVATDVGAIREIVRDHETGILVTPGSISDLVAALRTLAQNPEMRLCLGENARNLIRRHHDAAHNADRLLSLIQQTVDEARISEPASSRRAGIELGHGHG